MKIMTGIAHCIDVQPSVRWIVTLFSVMLILTVPVKAEDGRVKLQSDRGRLSLEFGSPETGFPLNEVYDFRAHRNLIKAGLPLWTVELDHQSGQKLMLTSLECDKAGYEHHGTSDAAVTWFLNDALERAVPGSGTKPGENLLVRCFIQLDDTRASLKLRIYNHSTTWTIRNVTFPELVLPQLGKSDEDDNLVFPFAAGKIIRRPLTQNFKFGGEQKDPSLDRTGLYPNPWTTMQFCAYWDNDGGFYIAGEDPLASAKFLEGTKSEDGKSLSIKMIWPAADAGVPGNDFEHPGSVALEVFDGDWFDAAKIYRRWASANAGWWPAMGPEGRPDTPRWMKEIAVWVLASLSPETIDQTIAFADFMGVPTAVHLYNWHQVPFDNDYPHYFPVKNGFRNSVKKLQEAGVRVMPYINARLWDSDTEDFKTFALPAAAKKENGEYYIEIYGSKEKLVPMCPTTMLWHNTIENIVMQLVSPEIGVDGVYLDQVSAMSPALCYDPSHGHPLGGGHWWTADGYWPMLEHLQNTLSARYPDKMLTSECNAEPYIHVFDGYLTWHFQFNNMVPLFSAVYGGAIQQFGRAYSGNDRAAHRMRIGQSLVFGEQLGWISPNIIEDKETAQFLREAARVRYTLLPFLSWGEMMRPPRISGNIPVITAEWGWAPEEKQVTDSAVQRGAWRSQDGRTAFIFANVSEDTVAFTWSFDSSDYGLGKKNLIIESWNGRGEPHSLKQKQDIPMHLSGREVQACIVSESP